jgi:lysophospholipase L1-like esterase
MRDAPRNVLLLLGSLLCALVLGEVALRVAGFRFDLSPERVEFGWPDPQTFELVFDPDLDLFWVPKGYAVELEKLSALERPLVFLGDSCTQFGGYVEAFAEALRARGKPQPALIKLGVGGWSSHQGLAQLRRDVAPRAPGVVSIYFGWNDHWIGFGVEDRELEEVRITRNGLLSQLRLAQLLTKARLASKLRAGRRPARVPPEEFRANLTAMGRIARSVGAAPLLLTAPTSHTRGAEPPHLAQRWIPRLSDLVPVHERYADIVREVASAESAALCDLHRSFAALPRGVRNRLFQQDGIHLVSAGDARIAELLVGCFEHAPELRAALDAAR